MELEDLANSFCLVAQTIENLIAVGQRARLEAQIAEFADMLLGRCLENEGN